MPLEMVLEQAEGVMGRADETVLINPLSPSI